MRRSTAFMAALLAAAALLTPTIAASEDGPVDCLLGPHFPETNLYYVVWFCSTGGQLGEPIRDTTGCVIGFPATDIRCNGAPLPATLAALAEGAVNDGAASVNCLLSEWRCEPVGVNPIACLTGAWIPETPLYAIIVYCLTGGALNITHCNTTPAHSFAVCAVRSADIEAVNDILDQIVWVPPCQLGPC